jgi:hypothetical protein
MDSDLAEQATLAVTADTFAATALITNTAGNFLGWGVVVPLYAVAILTTRVLRRWIGWLGVVVGSSEAGWVSSAGHPSWIQVSPRSGSSASSCSCSAWESRCFAARRS